MKILGIIPARGGSKGIPGKNIKLLGGKPLLQYTFESGSHSSLLTKLILSSDDEDIIKCAKLMGLEVPFKRPADLSQDNTPTLPVVQHALNYYLHKNETFDAVCILQPTYPFRKKGLIDKAINKFLTTDCDSLITVKRVPHEYNPHWVFEESTDGILKISTGDQKLIARRQELPPAFHRDGAIYLVKSNIVLNSNSLYGKKISWIENSSDFYVNLDTLKDWSLAISLLEEFLKG